MSLHGPTVTTFENAIVVLDVMEKWEHWLLSFHSDASCHLDSKVAHPGSGSLLLMSIQNLTPPPLSQFSYPLSPQLRHESKHNRMNVKVSLC